MKKRSVSAGILALTIASIAIFSGPALANTTVSRSLTLKASNTKVAKGTKVTFKGKLSAGVKKCKAHQQVQLFKGHKQVATTTTSSKGSYSFKRKIKKKATWHTFAPESSFGTHPNKTKCKAATSNKVTVKVT